MFVLQVRPFLQGLPKRCNETAGKTALLEQERIETVGGITQTVGRGAVSLSVECSFALNGPAAVSPAVVAADAASRFAAQIISVVGPQWRINNMAVLAPVGRGADVPGRGLQLITKSGYPIACCVFTLFFIECTVHSVGREGADGVSFDAGIRFPVGQKGRQLLVGSEPECGSCAPEKIGFVAGGMGTDAGGRLPCIFQVLERTGQKEIAQ